MTRQLINSGSTFEQEIGYFRAVVRVTYVLPDPADFPQYWPTLRHYVGDVRPAAMMILAALADPRMKIETVGPLGGALSPVTGKVS